MDIFNKIMYRYYVKDHSFIFDQAYFLEKAKIYIN